jgi:hypothetical protein
VGWGCAAWVLTEAPDLLVAEERFPPGGAEVIYLHARATQMFLAGPSTRGDRVDPTEA